MSSNHLKGSKYKGLPLKEVSLTSLEVHKQRLGLSPSLRQSHCKPLRIPRHKHVLAASSLSYSCGSQSCQESLSQVNT